MAIPSGYTNEQIIDTLYLALFRRGADVDGRTYWLHELTAHGDVNRIAEEMLAATKTPPAASFDLLAMIYQGLFGKAVDVGADTHWLPILEANGPGLGILDILSAGLATAPETPGHQTAVNRLAVVGQMIKAQAAQGMSLSVEASQAILAAVHDNTASRDQAIDDVNQQTGFRVQGDAAGVTLLANVKVFADANGNGRQDEGEAFDFTDAQGRYVLDRAHGPLTVTGLQDDHGQPLDNLQAEAHSADINPFTTLAHAMAATDARYADPAFADRALRAAFGLATDTGLIGDALRQLGADAPAGEAPGLTPAQANALILANLAIQDLLHAVDTTLTSAGKTAADDASLQLAASNSAMQALAQAVAAAADGGHPLKLDDRATVDGIMHTAAGSFGEAADKVLDLGPYVAGVTDHMTQAQASYAQSLENGGDATALAQVNETVTQSMAQAIDAVTNPPAVPEPPTPPVTPDPPPPPPPPVPPVVPVDPLVLTLAAWSASPPTQAFRIVDTAAHIGGASAQDLAALAGNAFFTGISAGGAELTLNIEQFVAIMNKNLDAQDTIHLADTAANLSAHFNDAGNPTRYSSTTRIDDVSVSDGNILQLSYTSNLDAGFAAKLSVNADIYLDTSNNIPFIDNDDFLAVASASTIDGMIGDGVISKAQFDQLKDKIAPSAMITVDLADWLQMGQVPSGDQTTLLDLLTRMGINHLSSFDMVMNENFVRTMLGETPGFAWTSRPDSVTLQDSADNINRMLAGMVIDAPVLNSVDAIRTLPGQSGALATYASILELYRSKLSMADSFQILLDKDAPLVIQDFTGARFSIEDSIVPDSNDPNTTLQLTQSFSGHLDLATSGNDFQFIQGSNANDNFTLGGTAVMLRGRGGNDQVTVEPGVRAVLQFEGTATLNGVDTISGFALGPVGAGMKANVLDFSTFLSGDARFFETPLATGDTTHVELSAANVVMLAVPEGANAVSGILDRFATLGSIPGGLIVIQGRGGDPADPGTATTQAIWMCSSMGGGNPSAWDADNDIQLVAQITNGGLLSSWQAANFVPPLI